MLRETETIFEIAQKARLSSRKDLASVDWLLLPTLFF